MNENNPTNYCFVYDSYYRNDNQWTECKCSDELCCFCANRPDEHQKDCECLGHKDKDG